MIKALLIKESLSDKWAIRVSKSSAKIQNSPNEASSNKGVAVERNYTLHLKESALTYPFYLSLSTSLMMLF